MIVDDFDILRSGRSPGPLEPDPPSVVDSNAVLASAVTLERFETIAGQGSQVLKGYRCFKSVELEPCGFFDARKSPDPYSGGEICSTFVAIADDHNPFRIIHYVKHIHRHGRRQTRCQESVEVLKSEFLGW